MRDDLRDVLCGFAVALVLFLGLSSLGMLANAPAATIDSCPDQQCLEAFVIDEPFPLGTIESPVMNVPEELRQRNWGGGSCVHASTVHLLRWQGQQEMADWWRTNYSGGEYSGRLNQRMESAGLRYAYTTSGDVAFLEYCMRTRRGAGIAYFPNHAINLVHLDEERAGLLDNNRTDRIIWVPRAEFLRNWKFNYGGWAWTLIYDPPPPLPYL